MGIAVAAFVAGLALFPFVGGTFMPDSDDEQLAVLVKAPVGSTLDYTRDRLREVSAVVRRRTEVAYTYETIGGGWTAQVNEAKIYVKLRAQGGSRSSRQKELAAMCSGGTWRASPG